MDYFLSFLKSLPLISGDSIPRVPKAPQHGVSSGLFFSSSFSLSTDQPGEAPAEFWLLLQPLAWYCRSAWSCEHKVSDTATLALNMVTLQAEVAWILAPFLFSFSLRVLPYLLAHWQSPHPEDQVE